jgi:small redox-active disulfide protein 2
LKTCVTMIIQVIGAGCAACKHMEADVQAVAARLGLDAAIERVDDLEQIMRFGLFVLPGLAVDGQIISAGYGGQRRVEKALREWCERETP